MLPRSEVREIRQCISRVSNSVFNHDAIRELSAEAVRLLVVDDILETGPRETEYMDSPWRFIAKVYVIRGVLEYVAGML